MEINEQWLKEQKRPGNTFCPMFFVHKHIDTRGYQQPCCVAKRRPTGWTDTELLEAGLASLNGVGAPECQGCASIEKVNCVSFRQDALNTVARFTDIVGQAIAKKQRYEVWYDLRVSNLCNLACIMCSPAASSTIAKKMGISVPIKRQPVPSINPNAKKVYLAGGEPFLIKEFQKVLQQLEDKNCEIVVNTNGTVVDTFLVNELKRFSNLCITLSVDGIDALATQIRVGTRWEVVEENVCFLKSQLPFATFLVNTVLQKDNVNHLLPLGRWVARHGFQWSVSVLQSPAELSVATLEQWNIPAELFKLAPVNTSLRTMQVLRELYNAPQNQRD